MNQPKNISPEDWAQYNASLARQQSLMNSGLASQQSLINAGLGCIGGQVADALPLLPDVDLEDLLAAVRRACNELQDMGPKSERIALQLLTAMARFEVQR